MRQSPAAAGTSAWSWSEGSGCRESRPWGASGCISAWAQVCRLRQPGAGGNAPARTPRAGSSTSSGISIGHRLATTREFLDSSRSCRISRSDGDRVAADLCWLVRSCKRALWHEGHRQRVDHPGQSESRPAPRDVVYGASQIGDSGLHVEPQKVLTRKTLRGWCLQALVRAAECRAPAC